MFISNDFLVTENRNVFQLRLLSILAPLSHTRCTVQLCVSRPNRSFLPGPYFIIGPNYCSFIGCVTIFESMTQSSPPPTSSGARRHHQCTSSYLGDATQLIVEFEVPEQ